MSKKNDDSLAKLPLTAVSSYQSLIETLRRTESKRAKLLFKQSQALLRAAISGQAKDLDRAVKLWQQQADALKKQDLLPKKLGRKADKAINELGTLAIKRCLGHPMHWPTYADCVLQAPQGIPVKIYRSPVTRSGSKIALLAHRGRQGKRVNLVLKSGQATKLRREIKGIQRWHALRPGLAPKVIGFHRNRDGAAVLLEKLNGKTFEQILLSADDATFDKGLESLIHTLQAHWQATRKKRAYQSCFMQQVAQRLPEIQERHPGLSQKILSATGAEANLKRAHTLENTVVCPCPVLMHGDMNIDNILIHTKTGKVYFIDLHRTGHADYLQDATVLMVSCIRVNRHDKPHRKRVKAVIKQVCELCERFAREQQDSTYLTRMFLGVARSLITSTRFIDDAEFAARMLERGVALLELVTATKPKHLSQMDYQKLFYVHM